MVLALARFGIASPAVARKIEKEWAKYRLQNGLDLYGDAAVLATERDAGLIESNCNHVTQKQ